MIPSLSQRNDCDVALHCTPKGVRAFSWCRGYKHSTPSGVVGVLFLNVRPPQSELTGGRVSTQPWAALRLMRTIPTRRDSGPPSCWAALKGKVTILGP